MIPERLRFLRQEAGLSKKELVERLPFNYSTYANYESGAREPNSDVLREIAKFYNVSIDYIVGHSTEWQSFSPEVKHIRAKDSFVMADGLALSPHEQSHIKLYRSLDEHGKRLVDSVLQMELERKERAAGLKAFRGGKKNRPIRPIRLKVFNQSASAGLGNYLGDYSEQDFEELDFVPSTQSTEADFAVRIQGDSMAPRFADGDIVYVKSTPQIEPDSIGIFIYDGESYCKRLKIDRNRRKIALESLNSSYAPMLIEQPDQLRTVGEVIGIAKKE